ncbi:MAG TPA: CHAT domain-containing protein [Leptolyngbyaceae cyanobacterium]
MDEERLQSYLNLINQLLTCENGQEPDILRRNQALIDAGLVQAMERVAGVLTQRGDSQQAEWLRQLANQLELGLASPPRLEKTEDRLVYRQVRSFEERFGKPHLYLAYHAAFPLALTPDLLYKIWANFQRDIEDKLLNIPWEAVADVLLSGFCKEVGGEELYEMDLAVRNVLLNELKANPRFGEERLKNLSEFVLEYIQEQIHSDDSNIRDFAQVQKWTALAYTKPDKAARELALALREKLQEQNKAELVRMASVVETLAEPLVGFEPLLVYSRGMGKLARGDKEEAFVKFRELGELGDWVRVKGVSLPVPSDSSVDKNDVIEDLIFRLEWSAINTQNKQAYINLIQLLINCPNGEEVNILTNYPNLVDRALVETIEQLASVIAKQGEQNLANFLIDMAGKLANVLDEVVIRKHQVTVSKASLENSLELLAENAEQWFNRGINEYEAGNLNDALPCFRRAIEIEPSFSYAWNGLANALRDLGQYEQAIEAYQRAIVIEPNFSYAWNGLANALTNLGQYEQAIAACKKVIQIDPNLYQAHHNLGNALRNLQRYEEAIASYDRAINLKNDYYQAWLDRGIAVSYSTGAKSIFTSFSPLAIKHPGLNNRGFEGALINYQEGLKYIHQDTHPEGWGQLHKAIGNAYYEQGQTNYKPRPYCVQAVASYHKALQSLTSSAFPILHLEVLKDLIKALLNLRLTAEAEELGQRGTDLLQRLLANLTSNEAKKQLALKFATFNDCTVTRLIEDGQIVRALELAENNKNSVLNWLLYSRKEAINSPKWNEIQQLLSPSTAAIYWYISPVSLTTFILKYNIATPIVLTTTNSNDYQRLQQFESLVNIWKQEYDLYREFKQRKATSSWRDKLPDLLKQLAHILNIPAIHSALTDIKQIILIPHHDLHWFPIHALFIDNFIVSYLPSIQMGLNLQKISSNPNTSLFSVESLDDLFTHIEVELINQFFPNSTRLYGNQVTEHSVQTLLQKPHSIFHFSGHTAHNFSNPQESALYLNETEKLTVRDILKIDLSSYRLVCLSGSETAITGNQSVLAEYVGLVSAFIGSGVAHVVSSLWPVDSAATALLMIYFYQQLKAGNTEVAALAIAQRWIRNVTYGELIEWYQGEIAKLSEDASLNLRTILETELERLNRLEQDHKPFNHPYYWAAFTITGTVEEKVVRLKEWMNNSFDDQWKSTKEIFGDGNENLAF